MATGYGRASVAFGCAGKVKIAWALRLTGGISLLSPSSGASHARIKSSKLET
jgi:hypothetical protein